MTERNTNINKDEIEAKPLEIKVGTGKQIPKELKPVECGKKQEVSLNSKDVLRLIERFVNKYLNYIIGNSENPVPSFSKAHSIFFIIIIVLLILLWIF